MTVVFLLLAIIDIVGNVIVCAIIKRNRDMRYLFILFLFTVSEAATFGAEERGGCGQVTVMGRQGHPLFCNIFCKKKYLFYLAYVNQNASIKQKQSTETNDAR